MKLKAQKAFRYLYWTVVWTKSTFFVVHNMLLEPKTI